MTESEFTHLRLIASQWAVESAKSWGEWSKSFDLSDSERSYLQQGVERGFKDCLERLRKEKFL